MKTTKLIIAMLLAGALCACATGPQTSSAPKKAQQTSWNEGVWNSVLGYHGPANTMSMAAGPM